MTTLFQRASNPLWFFLDLNAKPFDDTFFMFVLSNTIPYLPLVVYHDVLGTIPWDNPIQFGPNAALPEDIFWDPSEVYRLEFRKGNTQADALIYLVDQYTVNGNSITPPSSSQIIMSDNLLTNPQFSNVNFNTTIGFTSGSSSAQLQIAPGWFLTMDNSVTGVTVSQVAFQGSNDIVNNPSYAISIASTGTGNVELIQQFNNNGGLWGSTVNGSTAVPSSLAFNVTASSTTAVTLHAEIVYSNSSNAPVDLTDSLLNNSYVEYQGGSSNLPASTNTDPASTAYTQLEMYWAAGGTVTITNVQLIQELTATFFPVNYIQLPIERQIDQEAHILQPQLSYKPIPSYLVGWDFPLNPQQSLGGGISAGGTAGQSFYTWDQTIVFQSVNAGVSITNVNGAFVITAAAATQAAIIQYLDRNNIIDILTNRIAVNVAAYCSSSSGTKCTVSLWYTSNSSAPVVGANYDGSIAYGASVVTTLDSVGHPSAVASGWNEIPRTNNLGPATFTVGQKVNEEFFDYMMNGWDLSGISGSVNANFFAIVVGTATIPHTDTLSFNSVSLCTGDIATRPAPRSFSEELIRCQYFYQKSYNTFVNPTTVDSTNEILEPMATVIATSVQNVSLKSFTLEYQQVMRTAPNITFYSPLLSTANRAQLQSVSNNVITNTGASQAVITMTGGGGSYTASGVGNNRATLACTATSTVQYFYSTVAGSESYLLFHYVLDARIGVV